MFADRAELHVAAVCAPRPAGARVDTSSGAFVHGKAAVRSSRPLAASTLTAILDRLTRVQRPDVSAADREGIGKIYQALYAGGPNLRGEFGRSAEFRTGSILYRDDVAGRSLGRNQSFLGSRRTSRR